LSAIVIPLAQLPFDGRLVALRAERGHDQVLAQFFEPPAACQSHEGVQLARRVRPDDGRRMPRGDQVFDRLG
jgi:hypothetical protein